MAVPAGIGVALYLTGTEKASAVRQRCAYFVDVMTGVPSIVFGLFIYISLVISHVGGGSLRGRLASCVAADAADR